MVLIKSSLSSLALVACAQARYLASDLSFGHNGKISPNLRAIPNFHLLGHPNPPEILSNKVILTPPAPGNQRGAIWGEKALQSAEWTADIDFRASGPEHGDGNIQIWYVKDGQNTVGTSSIYTAGKFDGFVLTLDQYSGSGGMVRGFLNDGTHDYKSHHSVDSLAFGHCKFAFRNLGRSSRVHLRHGATSFRVEVDGNLCFESSKIQLPMGYNFGISAASAQNPDSFEVFELVVATETHKPEHDSQHVIHDTPKENTPPPVAQSNPGAYNDPPEIPASEIPVDVQFADLHNRLQAMMKHIVRSQADAHDFQEMQTHKITELSNQVALLSKAIEKFDYLQGMEKKIDHISYDVKQTKSDLHDTLKLQVQGIKNVVEDHHDNLKEHVISSIPSIFAYTIVVLGSQGVLIVAFLLYKRRKANKPKKYL
ncbi:hypothetical protein BP5796_09935 [Coleophoma crateriformis]|uniref:L-type lectin-like domain-containing protein n=1 Tax=Coleophoma crateriformis TaxID=565419 RepID=A0A3D8QTT3_9HELO|nr:hypothetical protein BP5796_09935 [Coleophoma crateriformis]